MNHYAMRVMRKQSTNKKERFDIEYGITEHRPARKRDKREAFDRGSADRLAYYIKRNPHYFNGGRTNAEAVMGSGDMAISQRPHIIRRQDSDTASQEEQAEGTAEKGRCSNPEIPIVGQAQCVAIP